MSVELKCQLPELTVGKVNLCKVLPPYKPYIIEGHGMVSHIVQHNKQKHVLFLTSHFYFFVPMCKARKQLVDKILFYFSFIVILTILHYS